MTGNKEFGRHELIETAMNRANSGASSEGERPTDPNAIWREEQARALKARQTQLEEGSLRGGAHEGGPPCCPGSA
jgi:hypothetical protein